MDALRSWIITLVSITVVCAIIEKFAPRGNLSKYVKLICGLVVTVVIVTPVISLLKGDFAIDNIAWSQYVKMSETELRSRIEKLQNEDKTQMLEIYRTSLINDIKARFKGHKDFLVTNADAVLYEDPDDKDFGLIRRLYLKIEPNVDNNIKTISNQTVAYIKNQLITTFGINDNQIIIDLSAFSGG
ncbi:MAG: stage III sporulation protein AF [Acetivibrionales bacterium]|jgi:stage III sporulation protein AF|nr:stage III sporulation protein AF [Clostridiaceae bacterium]